MRSNGREKSRKWLGLIAKSDALKWVSPKPKCIKREAYYKLKKEVHLLTTEVARSVVLDTRSYSLWLVQVKGFPWRDQCKWKDLKKLKRYLMSPEAREEAASITQAPPPRWGSGGGEKPYR